MKIIAWILLSLSLAACASTYGSTRQQRTPQHKCYDCVQNRQDGNPN